MSEEDDEDDFDEEPGSASLPEGEQTGETVLDVTVVPFEPITPGSGQGVPDKQGRLRKAIQDKITPERLAELRKERAKRVVTLTVLFYLWKGSPSVTNTRAVKDIDNLLKILLDVLGSGPQGLGLVESDSFISELYASKQIVESEQEEGYRIVIEEFKDDGMLNLLNSFYYRGK